MQTPRPIHSLDDAITYFDETLSGYPQRDRVAAQQAALDGERRDHVALTLNHLFVPDDTGHAPPHFVLPEVNTPDTPEGRLAAELVGMLAPLDMLNPVNRAFGLGRGTGTLVTCFGIPLNPLADDAPAYTQPMDELLGKPEPDPIRSGLMPEILDRIAFLKDHLPPTFKIALPDMQGPYNLAHAMVGEEALIGPYVEPDRFAKLMERITTLWISARAALVDAIGPDYLAPMERYACIAECSVNLISADMYRQHVLPHDRRIAAAFGPLHIHPCSGPHVFRVTLENLPVAIAEAGHIAVTASGSIGVDEALTLTGDRPITLLIGQELPVGEEEAFIQQDLQRATANPRLIFSYTGMHWRRKDRPMIRDLHRRLDAYWSEHVVGVH